MTKLYARTFAAVPDDMERDRVRHCVGTAKHRLVRCRAPPRA